MKRIVWGVAVLATLLGSCTKKTVENSAVTFSREDFKETKIMTDAEEIVIDSLLYPASFRLINDTALLVTNQPVCKYLLEIYSLKTRQPIAQLIPKGNGPGELKSCAALYHSNVSKDFYIQDYKTQTYYATHLDSLLHVNRFTPSSSFHYSAEVLSSTSPLVLDAETYVGCTMWYSPDKTFDNGVASPVAVYKKNEQSKVNQQSFKYFTGGVNGALLWKDKDSKKVWAADAHRDRISIYDDSLKVVRTFDGPDHFEMAYETVKSNAPFAFVCFSGQRDLRSYTDYFLTDKHIYLVYEGTEKFDPMNLSRAEVFKLDYNGNLLCNYKFDRNIRSISVDKAERYLFCASRQNMQDPPVILKYKL